jgi:hypothetical protein
VVSNNIPWPLRLNSQPRQALTTADAKIGYRVRCCDSGFQVGYGSVSAALV